MATVGLVAGSMLPVAPLRLLVATPLALLVPGWAVLLIAFDATQRPMVPATALTALLSLATYPLLAVGVGLGGRSLSRQGVLTSVTVLVLVALGTTICRGVAGVILTPPSCHSHEPTARASHGGTRPADGTFTSTCDGSMASIGTRRRELATLATYVLSALGATALALALLRLLPQAPPLAYTALSLAGRWAQLDHVVSQTEGHVTIPLQIANHTGHAAAYLLRIDVDGRPDGSARMLRLQSEATWDGAMVGTAARDRRLHRLRIGLTSGTSRQALTIWMQGAAPSRGQEPGSRRVPSSRAARLGGTGNTIGCTGCGEAAAIGGSGQAAGQDDSPQRAWPTPARSRIYATHMVARELR